MRILSLFLALFLTLLPENVSYVNTCSFEQEICFEDSCDVEEAAVIRAPQRVNGMVQTLSGTVSTDRKSVLILYSNYRPIPLCFERLWLAACTLRL